MLLQFSVENYMSIKDKLIFNLEPSRCKDHPENILDNNDYESINIAALYGSNASGKSNIYRAMTVALNIIRQSNLRQINQPIEVMPFKFDDKSIFKPSKFEFVFVADDKKKYVYGFSATNKEVVEEYLYVYHTAKPSKIYDFSKESHKISREYEKELAPIIDRNSPNKLFLATATSWNAECTSIPYKWLSEKIDAYTNDDNLRRSSISKYIDDDFKYIDFTKKVLQQADINISNIEIERKEMDLPSDPEELVINGNSYQLEKQYNYKIITSHKIKNKGHEVNYTLGLGDESLGTQQLFFLAPMIKDSLENGKVLIIDEIDRSLHPFIVKYLVNMFRDAKINKKGAQLIFTTHETTLLSLDIFRRDQIFFVEKDNESGVTELYSLNDFSVRNTENIEKGYLLGRYGAIPFMQTEEII